MPGISPTIAHKRARVASLSYAVRSGSRPQSDLDDAKKDLAYQGLAEHAARVVTGWPQPTDEQLQRIAAILRSGGAA
jgi:hypothetical protein